VSVGAELQRLLRSQGYNAAIKEVLTVWQKLGTLPGSIRRIPVEVNETKVAFENLAFHLTQAMKAATKIRDALPPEPITGLDPHAIERSWAERVEIIHGGVVTKSPKLKTGRPRNRGEEMLGLAVWGALKRGGVPKRKLATLTAECLCCMQVDQQSLERTIRSVRKLTKQHLN
jgi:hypothetical protein